MKNKIIDCGEYSLIEVCSKKYGVQHVKVSTEDLPLLEEWSTCSVSYFPCIKNFRPKLYRKVNGVEEYQRLYRVLVNCPAGMTVDHINKDTMDNRRENLKICSQLENNHNSNRKTIIIQQQISKKERRYNECVDERKGKFYTKVIKNGVKYDGVFDSEAEAILFRDSIRLNIKL